MRAIVGLMVLLVAGIVAIVGVLSNAGAAHPLTESFSLFGFHVTGSIGVVFLFGITVGAVASLGLAIVVTVALRTANRAHDGRRTVAHFQREMAFNNRDHDARLEHQQRADSAMVPPALGTEW